MVNHHLENTSVRPEGGDTLTNFANGIDIFGGTTAREVFTPPTANVALEDRDKDNNLTGLFMAQPEGFWGIHHNPGSESTISTNPTQATLQQADRVFNV